MTGTIAWHELYTSDVAAATRFYAELLGTEIETAQLPDLEYPMLKQGDRTHAGFFRKDHEDVPSHWYPYIRVDDVDASVDKAKSLGSEVYHGPVTVEEIRLAVLGDPQHATFGVLVSPDEPSSGFVAWDELHAADLDAAAAYYGDIFGWTTESFMEGYRTFKSGETSIAGLSAQADAGAFWLSYFAVEDTDAATARAQELGATVTLEPTSMENVGRFSILTDPTGAAFGLFAG